jgi:hypothetical protein
MEKVERECTFCGKKIRVPMDNDKIFKISCPYCACDFYTIGRNDYDLYLINNRRSTIKMYKIKCLNCSKVMAVPLDVEIIHECNCNEEFKAFYMGRFDAKGKYAGLLFVAEMYIGSSEIKTNLKCGPFILLFVNPFDHGDDSYDIYKEYVYTGGFSNGILFKYFNGDSHEFHFKSGLRNGTYKFQNEDGVRIVSGFLNDKQNGLYERVESSGDREISNYLDGKLNGHREEIRLGEKIHYLYKDGNMISKANYVINRRIWKKINYSNEGRNNQFELFTDHSESNKVGFGNYVNGEMHGHCQVLIEKRSKDGLNCFLEGYFSKGKCIEIIRVIDEFGRAIDEAGSVTFYG